MSTCFDNSTFFNKDGDFNIDDFLSQIDSYNTSSYPRNKFILIENSQTIEKNDIRFQGWNGRQVRVVCCGGGSGAIVRKHNKDVFFSSGCSGNLRSGFFTFDSSKNYSISIGDGGVTDYKTYNDTYDEIPENEVYTLSNPSTLAGSESILTDNENYTFSSGKIIALNSRVLTGYAPGYFIRLKDNFREFGIHYAQNRQAYYKTMKNDGYIFDLSTVKTIENEEFDIFSVNSNLAKNDQQDLYDLYHNTNSFNNTNIYNNALDGLLQKEYVKDFDGRIDINGLGSPVVYRTNAVVGSYITYKYLTDKVLSQGARATSNIFQPFETNSSFPTGDKGFVFLELL